jgi:hypothetical protein
MHQVVESGKLCQSSLQSPPFAGQDGQYQQTVRPFVEEDGTARFIEAGDGR